MPTAAQETDEAFDLVSGDAQVTDTKTGVRRANQRLDLLIARSVTDLALDLHGPTSQLRDSLGFLETGLGFFERYTREMKPEGIQDPDRHEANFFRRETQIALQDSVTALDELQKVQANLAMISLDAAKLPRLWSPVDLVTRAVDLSATIWRPALIVDVSAPGLDTMRMKAPPRPVLICLIEILIRLTQALRHPSGRTALAIILERDPVSGVDVVFEWPLDRSQRESAPSLVVAQELAKAFGGRLSRGQVTDCGSIRLRLPD